MRVVHHQESTSLYMAIKSQAARGGRKKPEAGRLPPVLQAIIERDL